MSESFRVPELTEAHSETWSTERGIGLNFRSTGSDEERVTLRADVTREAKHVEV